MIDINRRKFLAELGKLLTFMYEEDRQTALAMYEKMFDEASDEQNLIHFLVSPTRQAVVLARVYDAKARKLEVHAQAGKDAAQVSGGKLPAFVSTINDIHDEAVEDDLIAGSGVLENQISFFSDTDGSEFSSAITNSSENYAQPQINIPDFHSNDVAPLVEPDIVSPAAPAVVAAAETVLAEAPLQPSAAPISVEEAPAEMPAAAVSVEEAPIESADPVDVFMQDLKIEGISETEAATSIPAVESIEPSVQSEPDIPVSAQADTIAALDAAVQGQAPSVAVQTETDAADSILRKLPETELYNTVTVRKPIIPLLILFIIIAIPITALGIVLLLSLAAIFFAFAIAVGVTGFNALGAAFGGFTVFADILVVVGISLILIALGILFLWIFVWFLGGAVVGLVNGVVKLCGKICYKDKEELVK